ncbi:MAG: phosphoglucosamine mutase [Gammaproteobacteria bacterium]|nr:phosphoglucosamine mutase [Gammaproteobacteria bacterium]
MKKRYFGTDGIRGKVGATPISAEFMLRLGWAAGRVLAAKEEGRGKVVIGKDTRISGYMFESALQAGLSSAGVDVHLLGPMPTPAIAYLTRTLHAQAGIVISASHNPFYDNGIKFFSEKGGKLADDVELAIERELEVPMVTVDSNLLGKAGRIVDAAGRYIEFCKSTIPSMMELKGLKIVVDCAHGATYHVSPSVFKELGAEVFEMGVSPNGLNINEECGSTSPAELQAKVLAVGADVGIALDGDGDRVIMVDADGAVVDGDELLYIIARSRADNNEGSPVVVGTLMSNLGLEHALDKLGIKLLRANVGDRYVLERLRENNAYLGGESSGHIICLDRTTTGDGTVAALQVLVAMIESGLPLKDLRNRVVKCPQCLLNVRTEQKFNYTESSLVKAAQQEVESILGQRGRVLLRASGTEPVIRVMVEGDDPQEVRSLANQLATAVELAYQENNKIL